MFYVLLECAGILGDALCYDTLTNARTAAESIFSLCNYLECAGILGDAFLYDTLTNTRTAAEAIYFPMHFLGMRRFRGMRSAMTRSPTHGQLQRQKMPFLVHGMLILWCPSPR